MADGIVIAPAKVNLALHVGARRRDGYHPVDTVCAFVDIGETVRIVRLTDRFSVTISGPNAFAFDREDLADNLVLRGAKLIAEQREVPTVEFRIHKTAPVSSGIGAGTADGVGAMVLLNRLAKNPLSGAALIRLAAKLGADGPVCMAHMVTGAPTLRAQGVGEIIGVGPNIPPTYMCLANPGVSVATAKVFEDFDEDLPPAPFCLSPWSGAPVTVTGLASWVFRQRNDLRAAAMRIAPEIAGIEYAMAKRSGCLLSRMSGSGGTVFGLFTDSVSANRAAIWFKGQSLWSVSGPIRFTKGVVA